VINPHILRYSSSKRILAIAAAHKTLGKNPDL
jgi:hypothetical protein